MDAPAARFHALLAIGGGMLWIYFGGTLALRPARVPGVSFRASTDVLPWLGLGLLLIASAAGVLHLRRRRTAGPLGQWASRGLLAGAVLFASGHVLRQSLAGGWEPAVPLGFLTSVVCLVALGVIMLRERSQPPMAARAVLASGLCLLLFNDQQPTAWAAVPFGLLWILLGASMLRSTTSPTARSGTS